MIRFTLEDTEYRVQDNVIVKDNSHEELYSYIVTIPNSEKLDIETMDYATIEDDNGLSASMLVNAINEETISFNPMRYKYVLSMLSEAVKLQKIICPNLKITKRKIKKAWTIYEKIEQYFNIYVKPQYPELTLSSDLQTLLGDTICPEKMWNRPTMFEVFNDVASAFMFIFSSSLLSISKSFKLSPTANISSINKGYEYCSKKYLGSLNAKFLASKSSNVTPAVSNASSIT